MPLLSGNLWFLLKKLYKYDSYNLRAFLYCKRKNYKKGVALHKQNSRKRFDIFRCPAKGRYASYPFLVKSNGDVFLFYYTFIFAKGWKVYVCKNFKENYLLTVDGMANKGATGLMFRDRLYAILHSGEHSGRELKMLSFDPQLHIAEEKKVQFEKLHGDFNYPFFVDDNHGNLILLFSTKKDSAFRNYFAVSKDLEKWSEPKEINLIGNKGRRMACVKDHLNLFHMVWEVEKNILYSFSRDFMNWETPLCVDDNSQRPKISTVNGAILVAYEKQEEDVYYIILSKVESGDVTKHIIHNSKEEISRPSNCIDYEDKLIVSWSKFVLLNKIIEYKFLDKQDIL
jgi:hypothetical protein